MKSIRAGKRERAKERKHDVVDDGPFGLLSRNSTNRVREIAPQKRGYDSSRRARQSYRQYREDEAARVKVSCGFLRLREDGGGEGRGVILPTLRVRV